MKTYIKSYSLAFASALLSLCSACSDIPEDERYLPASFPPAQKSILIGEFSGIRCTNCPDGAQTIHEILDIYPDSVIAVSFHPRGEMLTSAIDGFSISCKEAAEYYKYFERPDLPSACVNFGETTGNRSKWLENVVNAVSQEPSFDLYLRSHFDSSTRELSVDYNVGFRSVSGAPVNIILWIVENGIVGPQKYGSDQINDYVHNHVLRCAIGDVWGEELSTPDSPEISVSGNASVVVNDKWNADNCKIVGVIMNRDNKNINQASQIDLTGDSNFPGERN